MKLCKAVVPFMGEIIGGLLLGMHIGSPPSLPPHSMICCQQPWDCISTGGGGNPVITPCWGGGGQSPSIPLRGGRDSPFLPPPCSAIKQLRERARWGSRWEQDSGWRWWCSARGGVLLPPPQIPAPF